MRRSPPNRTVRVRDTDSVRKSERRQSAGHRQAAAEGVAAYLADEDADVYNTVAAAVEEDALAAALNLTALAAEAITALAATTERDPHDVLRSLRQQRSEQPALPRDPATDGSGSPPEVQIVYPDMMDDYDWAVTRDKGWIEVAVRWVEGEKTITFYDPNRLALEVQRATAQLGYFAEPAVVVVPDLTKDAIEAAVTIMAGRDFVDVS